jgi:hypothetical protein
MIFSIEEFKERNLNMDLMGNDFDIVLLRKYHIGIMANKKSNKLITLYLQNTTKTYMLGLWFSKIKARSYFKSWPDSPNYKKTIFGSLK